MFVEHNLIKNIKIFTLAFTLTVVLIQLSRFISPLAIIHSSYIFLAWMPLCVMLSILFIFGWRGVVPVLCGMFCTNLWNFHLSFLQTAVMLGSQTFVVLCACAILRWQLGTRWRYGLTSRYVWQRLFWLGLVTPIGIKCSMYLVGSFFDFPLKISTFFGDADAIFTVVDLLSLFTAVLIYNMLFYYLTRMIVSPHFAQILWRRDIAPSLGKEKRAFTLSWLAALSVLLLLLCTPYENDFIAGYLVPVFFIIFTLGVGKLRYPFLNLTWAVSTLCLLNYNQNFLQGVETEYSLAFILAVLISFSVNSSGQLRRQPLFDFNQHQQRRITAILFWCLMKGHHMRMLCQPQRCLLLQNMLPVPMHHAGAKHMFTAAGGNQRPQFLLGLQLRQTV